MKKTVSAIFFLLTLAALLFSCKSTDKSAYDNSKYSDFLSDAADDENADIVDEEVATLIAEEEPIKGDEFSEAEEEGGAGEERISQDELDEMNALLAMNNEPPAKEEPPMPEEEAEPDLSVMPVIEELKNLPDEAIAQAEEPETEELTQTATPPETSPPMRDPILLSMSETETPPQRPNESDAEISSSYDFEKGGDGKSPINTDTEDALSGDLTEAAEKEEIIPSRSMDMNNMQFLDITYPGSGWIYLGDVLRNDNFIFLGRSVEETETVFSLRSKKSGNSILHFYKNDLLSGNYIDDYIEINIADDVATDNKKVVAPSYADFVPQRYRNNEEARSIAQGADRTEQGAGQGLAQVAGERTENGVAQSAGQTEQGAVFDNANSPQSPRQTQTQQGGFATSTGEVEDAARTTIQTARERDERIAAALSERNQGLATTPQGGQDELLTSAQKAYDEKRFADALGLVRRFFNIATKNFDAGLFLEGRILEAKSEIQNIRDALSSYENIVKNWPQSSFYKRAKERSVYLKRFYIDIY